MNLLLCLVSPMLSNLIDLLYVLFVDAKVIQIINVGMLLDTQSGTLNMVNLSLVQVLELDLNTHLLTPNGILAITWEVPKL